MGRLLHAYFLRFIARLSWLVGTMIFFLSLLSFDWWQSAIKTKIDRRRYLRLVFGNGQKVDTRSFIYIAIRRNISPQWCRDSNVRLLWRHIDAKSMWMDCGYFPNKLRTCSERNLAYFLCVILPIQFRSNSWNSLWQHYPETEIV